MNTQAQVQQRWLREWEQHATELRAAGANYAASMVDLHVKKLAAQIEQEVRNAARVDGCT